MTKIIELPSGGVEGRLSDTKCDVLSTVPCCPWEYENIHLFLLHNFIQYLRHLLCIVNMCPWTPALNPVRSLSSMHCKTCFPNLPTSYRHWMKAKFHVQVLRYWVFNTQVDFISGHHHSTMFNGAGFGDNSLRMNAKQHYFIRKLA